MALLEDALELVVFTDDVSRDAISYARGASSRAARIASCFLELEHLNQELRRKLRDDFDSILNNMGNISVSSISKPTSSPSSPPCSSPSAVTFIPEAYSWLLENIANPYPPPSIKASLTERYNCSPSAVNSWFVNARRRMGWTALCRDYFHNCRAEAVDAAYRALVKEDPNRLLSPEITHAFMVVKVAAEGLYSSSVTKSALAVDLDAVVKDMTAEDSITLDEKRSVPGDVVHSLKERETFGSQKCVLDGGPEREMLAARSCCPSPNQSHPPSPLPALDESLTDESEDEEEIFPPVLAGRKRRSPPTDLGHTAWTGLSTRPIKRLRTSTSSYTANACAPTTTVENEPPNQSPYFAHCSQSYTNTAVSRKRHLSDTVTDASPKCPRDLLIAPRLHAISDPLPRPHVESESSVDEWFNTNFDSLFALPPPVDAVVLDPSTQWEVDLFNNYTIPQPAHKRPSKSLTSPTCDIEASQLTVFENLLQSLERCEPSETIHPSTMVSSANSISPDPSLSSELASIDWPALLEETAFQPTIHSISSQTYANTQPLPEIDLSILQLPRVLSTVSFEASSTEIQSGSFAS